MATPKPNFRPDYDCRGGSNGSQATGAGNVNSKFKEFLWPKIDDIEMAKRAAQQGLMASFFVAIFVALIPDFSISFYKVFPSEYLNWIGMALWFGLGAGIYYMSRLAAITAFILFVLERLLSLQDGERAFGLILALLLAMAFLTTIRATLRYHELGGDDVEA